MRVRALTVKGQVASYERSKGCEGCKAGLATCIPRDAVADGAASDVKKLSTVTGVTELVN